MGFLFCFIGLKIIWSSYFWTCQSALSLALVIFQWEINDGAGTGGLWVWVEEPVALGQLKGYC